MYWLTIGIALWCISHFFKRLAPTARERMGDKGKGLVALASLLAVVLMVVGYRSAPVIAVYAPVPGMGHLNNLLMLVSVFLFAVSHSGGVVESKLRHPMLIGVIVWAVAHLLVNGDLASILLFASMGAWAVVSMALINRAAPWERPAKGVIMKDIRIAVITLVVYGLIAGIHIWLGHSPFQGTYA